MGEVIFSIFAQSNLYVSDVAELADAMKDVSLGHIAGSNPAIRTNWPLAEWINCTD